MPEAKDPAAAPVPPAVRVAPDAEGADVQVLARVCDWLRAGERVALVTVVRTWGSSPRPPGSLLAMSASGSLVGSVSGGCVEAELLARFQARELAEPFPTQLDFGVDREDAGRLGLPCGGRLELLIEGLPAPEPCEALLRRLASGVLVARRVCLRTGEVSLHPGEERPELAVSDAAVIKVFGPAWHLLLIGDGQLARLLATMARLLDYGVTICDPREGFADPAPLPGVAYSRLPPDEAVLALGDRPRIAIVTLAHDPRQDDLALIEALPSRAFYVGALGSRRTAAARRERLGQMGLTETQIGRLRGPAGLPIGSKRPAEIALSILAEITAVRNALTTPPDPP
jgi:xanthine dehydrogenase accessory factor